LSGGNLGFARMFLGDSFKLGTGTALYGLELEHTDGPWANEDDYQKLNTVLRYSEGDSENGWNLMVMAYKGKWDSSDQMARRGWDNGFPFYDAVDPTTGGDSQRYSVLWNWRRTDTYSSTKALLYGSYYDIDLFSNFTYFLDDPENGDQFEQKERRALLGGQVSHTFFGTLFGLKSDTTLGLQMRHDDIRAGLWHTRERNRLETTRYDHVKETSLGVYAENKTQWAPWFRTVVGVRGDYIVFDNSNGTGGETGREGDFIASPKLNLIFGPWAKTEVYLSGGFGFHSNDARGVTDRDFPADPLVRTKGAEVGIRTTAVEGLQSTLALWVLDINSELIFVGDAGNTEAGRGSRRWGIEWANYYDVNKYLTLDADFSWSNARFRDVALEGQRVPGSVETVITAGVTLHDIGPWFAAVRMRFFGPRDLVEDGSARSNGTMLFNAQVGYRFNDTWSATLEVFNLLNSEDSDIDYFYASRLPGEIEEGVDDFHSHPVEPRALRLTVTARF
jgi:outer membrane receptor protein involved in Fe transport